MCLLASLIQRYHLSDNVLRKSIVVLTLVLTPSGKEWCGLPTQLGLVIVGKLVMVIESDQRFEGSSLVVQYWTLYIRMATKRVRIEWSV